MMCPCKGCKDRFLACHDSCPKYKLYRQELDQERDNERRIKQNEGFSKPLYKK